MAHYNLMNLCMVNAFFYPYLGGIEKHMLELASRIAKKEEVHVITSQISGAKPEEKFKDILIHRIPVLSYKVPVVSPPPFVISPRFKKKLKYLDTTYNFDSFGLHSRYMPDFNYVLKYAKKKNKFSTFTVHDQKIVGVNIALDHMSTLYDDVYGVKSMSNASKFIAVSNSVAKDLEEMGFDQSVIKTIYNGVDTAFFKPSKQTYREKYGQGFDNLIICAGRIVIQKGIQYLIRAMPQILENHPSTKLLIVGTGSFEPYLKLLVNTMKLEKNIEFTGFIPDQDLPNMYSSADVFIAPSLVEPFGLVVLEAMSCGVPVVASKIGGIPEVLDDCGLLVKPKDKNCIARSVNLLLLDKNLGNSFSKKGRKRAEETFNWDLIAKQTLKFYLENIR